MTDWLLLMILTVGTKSSIVIDSIMTNRFPTQVACEVAGVAAKKAAKHQAAFTCVEVNKLNGRVKVS